MLLRATAAQNLELRKITAIKYLKVCGAKNFYDQKNSENEGGKRFGR